MYARRTIRSRQGTVAEFPIALFVLMFMGVFPLIDLTAVALGAASGSLLAHQSATVTSSKRRYNDCLQAMSQESNLFMNSNFAKFLRIQPIGGYQGSGADLYVDASSYRQAGAVQTFGPNSPVPPPVDLSTNVYECSVEVKYQVGPFLNLGAVPFVGSVPGLGKPAILTFRASRAAEFPNGLEGVGSTMAAGQTVPSFDTTASPDTVPSVELGSSGSGWNYPNIYSMIAQAGQTVVMSEVIAVPANIPVPPQSLSSQWTPTGVTIAPGQKVWLDLRSDGMWSSFTGSPVVNADGKAWRGPGFNNGSPPMPSATEAALLGKVGNSAPFVVGTDLLNYAPGQTGPVSLIMNDNSIWYGYTDNIGYQFVRIIVTQ